MINLPYIVKRR